MGEGGGGGGAINGAPAARMAQVPTQARMLVFMVGSSGVLVLLSGDHARFVPVPQRGQKNPARGGAVTEEGAAPSRSMRASPSSPAGTAARQPGSCVRALRVYHRRIDSAIVRFC